VANNGLYLSRRKKDAQYITGLTPAGITHIVNCAEELPCYFLDDFSYLPLYLSDPDSYFKMSIDFLCRFIDEAWQKGRILIHCNGAVSRSPACLLAYLCHQGRSLFEAAEILRDKIHTRPNIVFISQLADYLTIKITEAQAEEILRILGGQN